MTELRPTADGTDLGFAGEGTVAEPGLLVLRIDGPLYTANVRTVNRRILEAVDRARPVTVVVDLSAVTMTTVTVAMQFVDLQRELDSRGVTIWVAGLTPRTMELARNMPQLEELETAGGVHPTALAAAHAFRMR